MLSPVGKWTSADNEFLTWMKYNKPNLSVIYNSKQFIDTLKDNGFQLISSKSYQDNDSKFLRYQENSICFVTIEY